MTARADIQVAKRILSQLPTNWEGKRCVLELKAANYNWKQMEWWAFYFELLCRQRLHGLFEIPGEAFTFTRSSGRKTLVKFDAKRSINWDFKAKAVKSNDHRAILNDQQAMNLALQEYGGHGLMIALCDVEYNDEKRAFQKWHEKLKGGKSEYEIARQQRTAVSRYRKTHATLTEILFLVVKPTNVELLDLYHQGRNSDGTPRPPKYMLDLEKAGRLIADRLVFE